MSQGGARPLIVTGGTGYLGSELLRQAADRPLVATYLRSAPGGGGPTWMSLDVRDAEAVRRTIEEVRPTAVVHTAYRQDGEGARETTVGGAESVAAAAHAVGARLVHLSSDVIFDGTKPGRYTRTIPRPRSPTTGARRPMRSRAVFVRSYRNHTATILAPHARAGEPEDEAVKMKQSQCMRRLPRSLCSLATTLIFHFLIRHHKLIQPRFAIIELVFLAFFEGRTHIIPKFEFLLADDDEVSGNAAFA